jgi:hypothetical protein
MAHADDPEQDRIAITCSVCHATYVSFWRDKGPLTDLEVGRVRDIARREGWAAWGQRDYCPDCLIYFAERVFQLLSDLNKASDAVPADVAQERRRQVRVLKRLSQYIRQIGGTFEQAHYIRDIAQTFDDLGVTHPGMRPHKYGKRADTSAVWRARGQVATGLEALTRSGMSRPEAAKSALKDLPRIKRLLAAKSKDPLKAVLSWHDEFRRSCEGKGRSKNRELADTLEVGREFLEKYADNPVALRNLARTQFRIASRI